MTASEHAPVRRAKVLHLDLSRETSPETIAEWDDVPTPILTLEDLEADLHNPRARARALLQWPGQRLRDAGRHFSSLRQRARYGYSTAEVWNLDEDLCRHLGSILAIHAVEARNHPPELAYDDWMRQLREASEALLANDPDDASRVADARRALHWAADNLVDLWD